MARYLNFETGEFYHVYNRGNSKQTIFKNETDYNRFLKLLYLCNGELKFTIRDLENSKLNSKKVFDAETGKKLVSISSYCLMPNHYHLMIKELVPNGVSLFMQKLGTGYVMYFNKTYQRTGSLFEGRYKAKHVDNNNYFNYLIAYINLNPVSKLVPEDWENSNKLTDLEILNYAKTYPYSSYLDFINKERLTAKIIDENSIKEILPDFEIDKHIKDFAKFKLEKET